MQNWCEAIEQLGDYEFTDAAKQKILNYRNKEANKEKDNETADTEG